MSDPTVLELLQDVDFLARRAELAGRYCSSLTRDYGLSANALVRAAYGGPDPSASELPADWEDLRACERAFRKLPPHRVTEPLLRQLQRARDFVALRSRH